MLLRSPLPMALSWGEDGVLLYNDGYAILIGGRHPQALGSKVLESWPEYAELNGEVLRIGLSGGTRSFRSLELRVHRSGAPEQVWIDVDCSPVRCEIRCEIEDYRFATAAQFIETWVH
jgi:hypothetical protein